MAESSSDFIAEARACIRELDAEAVMEMLDKQRDVLLVDVRELWEFEKGHIPGALLIPRGMLEGAADPHSKHRVRVLYEARGRPVVLYCDTGSRSALAAATLQQMGFREVYRLAGGLNLWQAEDLPVEEGADPEAIPVM